VKHSPPPQHFPEFEGLARSQQGALDFNGSLGDVCEKSTFDT
jgi:hypothetical protein